MSLNTGGLHILITQMDVECDHEYGEITSKLRKVDNENVIDMSMNVKKDLDTNIYVRLSKIISNHLS